MFSHRSKSTDDLPRFNAIVVGNENVGKTSFVKRLTCNEFQKRKSITQWVDTFQSKGMYLIFRGSQKKVFEFQAPSLLNFNA